MKRALLIILIMSLIFTLPSCTNRKENTGGSESSAGNSEVTTMSETTTGTVTVPETPDKDRTPSGIESELISVVEGNGSKWPTYGRVIELKHNGKKNGRLIATSQWAGRSFPIYTSVDGGKTWGLMTEVSEQIEKELNGNWQPDIYELPCAVGDMPEGTLILGGCTHDNDMKKVTKISLWRSFNAGLSWEQFTEIDRGNGVDDGMYEPYILCDEDGSLVVFYSDETEVSELHGQRLVFKVSKNGVDWSEKQYCVAPKSKALRPGMVSVAKMGDEGYLIVYEMIGMPGGPVYYKTSKSLTKWNYESLGTKLTDKNREFTGCTPYCTWTPAGGPHGTVIACGRFGDQNCRTQSKIFLSGDLGKTWTAVENPLKWDYLQSSGANYAYSFGFGVASDGSVFHIANCFPADEKQKYIHSALTFCRFKVS